MAFVLAFARGLHVLPAAAAARASGGRERDSDDGVVHLPEATALIVGVGGIGAETARLAAAFGMTRDRRRRAPRATRRPGVAELHRADALDELLPRADFVILTVPHTPRPRAS